MNWAAQQSKASLSPVKLHLLESLKNLNQYMVNRDDNLTQVGPCLCYSNPPSHAHTNITAACSNNWKQLTKQHCPAHLCSDFVDIRAHTSSDIHQESYLEGKAGLCEELLDLLLPGLCCGKVVGKRLGVWLKINYFSVQNNSVYKATNTRRENQNMQNAWMPNMKSYNQRMELFYRGIWWIYRSNA